MLSGGTSRIYGCEYDTTPLLHIWNIGGNFELSRVFLATALKFIMKGKITRILDLHAKDPGSISGNPSGPLSTPRVIFECKARNNF